MKIKDAKKIVYEFSQSIIDLRPNSIVQNTKSLPCTAARIKYAHFICGEDLVLSVFEKGKAREDMQKDFERKAQILIESYGLIDSLFNEDSEWINEHYIEYIEGLNNNIITDFSIPNPFGEMEQVNEFYNFLGETWFIRYQTNAFNRDIPLGSFIYERVRRNAVKERDLETLKELANTDLTRTVLYPGKI